MTDSDLLNQNFSETEPVLINLLSLVLDGILGSDVEERTLWYLGR